MSEQQSDTSASGRWPNPWHRAWDFWLQAARHVLGGSRHEYQPGGGCFSTDCRLCGKPASTHRREPEQPPNESRR